MLENILITGGAGFIGTNLIKKLNLEKYNVSVIDNFSNGSRDNLPKSVSIFEGDIRDKSFLKEAILNQDIIIHLAAYGSVVDSVTNPEINFEVNVQGTFNLLNQAKVSGVKKFIFASTGGALIGNAVPPVNEKSLPKPISPYGSSKLCGEAYCHSFAKAFNMNTICLRFANIYGPFSMHKKGAITKFIKSINKDEPITIYGDGSSTRDYLYIDDLCNGIIRTIEKNLKSGSVLHLASGKEVTILDLVKLLTKIANKPNYPINFESIRSGEVEKNFANYEKAFVDLNFQPKIDLENGLKTTWMWYKNFLK